MQLEETIWQEILKLWNQPRLLPPMLHEKASKAPVPVQREIAAFTYQDRQIHINLEKLAKELGTAQGILHAVACHEAGHHALIPYSPAISLRLINSANKALKDWEKSQFMENIFDDTILNTYIFQNSEYFGKELVKLLAKMREMKKDKFGQLYLKTYEHLWKLQPETLVSTSKEIDSDAFKIARILEDNTFTASTWQDKIYHVSSIAKKYLPSHCARSCKLRKPGELGEIDKALQEIAREFTLKEFYDLAAGLGLGSKHHINEQYYAGKAKQYSIKMPETRTMAGDLYPDTPKTWLPSEPVSRLNIPYTLQMFGKIIPGVTTRQWDYKQGVTWQQGKATPDILVILDSSGSMPKPHETLSYPVLASYIVSESALDNGCKVAAINFSSDVEITPYTYDRSKIRRGLSLYQGGGTTFPTQEFLTLLHGNTKRQHIFMITDGCIENLEEWLKAMSTAREKATGTFFLSGMPKEAVDQLKAMNYRTHPLQSNEDLIKITEAETHELYG